jgi:hypothetical protein
MYGTIKVSGEAVERVLDKADAFTESTKHLSNVVAGDIVICPDGVERTVSRQDIKIDPFVGRTLFGDSYRLGQVPVRVLKYKNPPSKL